jgi:hypothetical protein
MSDIHPTLKGFVRNTTQPISSSLYAEDINMRDPCYADKAKRSTNPLDPIYNIAGSTSYGFIEGSKKIEKVEGLPQKQSNSLKTDDI